MTAWLAIVLAAAPAFAQDLAPTYEPSIPGKIAGVRTYSADSQNQWRAVLSKRKVGIGDHGEAFFQWYLSLYALDGAVYRLRYRSPRDGGPFSQVARADGARLWFPIQTARIVGAAVLAAPGTQLVVASHEFAADCGMGMVTVLDSRPRVVVTNGCDLGAKIVRGGAGPSLALSGPYYAPSAPLCCPTKPRASSRLRYLNGAWLQKPVLFLVSAPSTTRRGLP